MIKFTQPQAVLRFDADPIVISSIVDDQVNATVRLICTDSTTIVNVGISPPGAPTLPTTQNAPAPGALRVSFTPPYISVIAQPIKPPLIARSSTRIVPNPSGSIILTVLHGGDDTTVTAARCAAAIGEQLTAASRAAAPSTYTHEAQVVIPMQNIASPVRMTATAMVGNVAVAMIAAEASLLDSVAQLLHRVDDPIVKVRTVAGATIVTTDADVDHPVDVYLREVGQTTESSAYVPLSLDMRDPELRFSKSTANAAILVTLRGDGQTNRSSGKRLALASGVPARPDARLVLMPGTAGVDVNVINIVNADVVIVMRMTLGDVITLGPTLVGGRDSVSFVDTPPAGTHVYVVKLISGTNVRNLPAVTFSVRGDPFTPRPIVSSVTTTTAQAGFVTRFDIASPLQFGDATSARSLISGVGDANLYAAELADQRSNYDPLPVFGVVRIDRDTGNAVDLGVVPSGTFSDTVPAALGLEHVRYVVTMALRDPLSLLPGALTVVTGSGQAYSYEAAVFRHPYALDDGTIVETQSRALKHPELDALVDATLAPSIVDVSFDQADTGTVSLTARRISIGTVLLQIDDNLHDERDGYVIIAAYGDGTYELVGYVNALFVSTHRAYHDVTQLPASVTYGMAIVNRSLTIERFIIGPTVTLT